MQGYHLLQVMNTNSKQWYAGPPTPMPLCSMKTATVGDECYFMGGYNDTGFNNTVYSVSLSALTTGLNSSTSKAQIWKEISGLQTTRSAPLSISGSLLAFGGKGKDCKAVTAIHLYQPDTAWGVGEGWGLANTKITLHMYNDYRQGTAASVWRIGDYKHSIDKINIVHVTLYFVLMHWL